MQEFRKRTKGSGNLKKNRFDDAVEFKAVTVNSWDSPNLRFKRNLLAVNKFM